jgi:hypothetical protein
MMRLTFEIQNRFDMFVAMYEYELRIDPPTRTVQIELTEEQADRIRLKIGKKRFGCSIQVKGE